MVSLDPPDRNAAFSQAHGDGFPVLSDPTGDTARAYGVLPEGRSFASRVTFFIDAEGVLRHVDRNVKPTTAGADVAARLEQLGFAKR